MHWFPKHGKSMDTFRADVAKAMTGEVKPVEPEKPKPVDNNVTKVQTLLNNKFNSGLVVDGSWGPASKKALIKAVQQSINNNYGGKLVADGSWGNLSKKACPDIYAVTTGNIALCIQIALIAKGYDIEPDGSYGNFTKTTITNFQKEHKLVSNGVCGKDTFSKLLA